jgi:hypothetical protein
MEFAEPQHLGDFIPLIFLAYFRLPGKWESDTIILKKMGKSEGEIEMGPLHQSTITNCFGGIR